MGVHYKRRYLQPTLAEKLQQLQSLFEVEEFMRQVKACPSVSPSTETKLQKIADVKIKKITSRQD